MSIFIRFQQCEQKCRSLNFAGGGGGGGERMSLIIVNSFVLRTLHGKITVSM